MKLVFYSVVLNHHQAPVADEFYRLLGNEYCFVELINLGDMKGATDDYSKRPYLLRAWESTETHERAMELARTADCCVFGGTDALPFEKERMKLGLLSFDMGERWLKKGWKSLASPRLLKWLSAYYIGGWSKKPIYKLCMSAFAAEDHNRLGTFKGKCYKWGYFTQVNLHNESPSTGSGTNHPGESFEPLEPLNLSETANFVRLMWCARFIDWKHPELAILLAERLKQRGSRFQLDMFGDGEMREALEQKSNELGLSDCVKFHGNIPNEQIHQAMQEHNFFLFTSDRGEGWGAVANEAMSEGCLLIGSDEIGAVPYLVKDGENGLIFKSRDLDSLYEKVDWAIEHSDVCLNIREAAKQSMQNVWSPENAAMSLLKLIDNLKQGKDTPFDKGPCSPA